MKSTVLFSEHLEEYTNLILFLSEGRLMCLTKETRYADNYYLCHHSKAEKWHESSSKCNLCLVGGRLLRKNVEDKAGGESAILTSIVYAEEELPRKGNRKESIQQRTEKHGRVKDLALPTLGIKLDR